MLRITHIISTITATRMAMAIERPAFDFRIILSCKPDHFGVGGAPI
jgi:hypothetical protein